MDRYNLKQRFMDLLDEALAKLPPSEFQEFEDLIKEELDELNK